jgi:CelD/BcsL family acetyltransferase involved in cellulose biosynthesis
MVGLVLGQSALDEFHAHGVQFNAGWATLAAPGFRQLELVRASRGVDLEKVRAEGDYLALISANSRSKIRKTFKDAAQWGALRLEIATDADQARAMYDTLCRLHIEAWNARGKPGAFANPHLLEFHRRLILTRLNHGDIQLATVHAGEQLLGVLYNFVHRGHIYSYQSGFDYLLGAKNFRPGLLVHTMAIEHNAKLGHGYYDFMAGDSQYKRSMGTRSGALHWVVYQRKSLKFQIEYTLRGIKGRLRPPPAAAAPASADQA